MLITFAYFIKRKFGNAGCEVTRILMLASETLPDCKMDEEKKGEYRTGEMDHFPFS